MGSSPCTKNAHGGRIGVRNVGDADDAALVLRNGEVVRREKDGRKSNRAIVVAVLIFCFLLNLSSICRQNHIFCSVASATEITKERVIDWAAKICYTDPQLCLTSYKFDPSYFFNYFDQSDANNVGESVDILPLPPIVREKVAEHKGSEKELLTHYSSLEKLAVHDSCFRVAKEATNLFNKVFQSKRLGAFNKQLFVDKTPKLLEFLKISQKLTDIHRYLLAVVIPLTIYRASVEPPNLQSFSTHLKKNLEHLKGSIDNFKDMTTESEYISKEWETLSENAEALATVFSAIFGKYMAPVEEENEKKKLEIEADKKDLLLGELNKLSETQEYGFILKSDFFFKTIEKLTGMNEDSFAELLELLCAISHEQGYVEQMSELGIVDSYANGEKLKLLLPSMGEDGKKGFYKKAFEIIRKICSKISKQIDDDSSTKVEIRQCDEFNKDSEDSVRKKIDELQDRQKVLKGMISNTDDVCTAEHIVNLMPYVPSDLLIDHDFLNAATKMKQPLEITKNELHKTERALEHLRSSLASGNVLDGGQVQEMNELCSVVTVIKMKQQHQREFQVFAQKAKKVLINAGMAMLNSLVSYRGVGWRNRLLPPRKYSDPESFASEGSMLEVGEWLHPIAEEWLQANIKALDEIAVSFDEVFKNKDLQQALMQQTEMPADPSAYFSMFVLMDESVVAALTKNRLLSYLKHFTKVAGSIMQKKTLEGRLNAFGGNNPPFAFAVLYRNIIDTIKRLNESEDLLKFDPKESEIIYEIAFLYDIRDVDELTAFVYILKCAKFDFKKMKVKVGGDSTDLRNSIMKAVYYITSNIALSPPYSGIKDRLKEPSKYNSPPYDDKIVAEIVQKFTAEFGKDKAWSLILNYDHIEKLCQHVSKSYSSFKIPQEPKEFKRQVYDAFSAFKNLQQEMNRITTDPLFSNAISEDNALYKTRIEEIRASPVEVPQFKSVRLGPVQGNILKRSIGRIFRAFDYVLRMWGVRHRLNLFPSLQLSQMVTFVKLSDALYKKRAKSSLLSKVLLSRIKKRMRTSFYPLYSFMKNFALVLFSVSWYLMVGQVVGARLLDRHYFELLPFALFPILFSCYMYLPFLELRHKRMPLLKRFIMRLVTIGVYTAVFAALAVFVAACADSLFAETPLLDVSAIPENIRNFYISEGLRKATEELMGMMVADYHAVFDPITEFIMRSLHEGKVFVFTHIHAWFNAILNTPVVMSDSLNKGLQAIHETFPSFQGASGVASSNGFAKRTALNVSNVFGGIISAIYSIFAGPFTAIYSLFAGVFSLVYPFFEGPFSALYSFFRGMFSLLSTFFGGIFTSLYSFFVAIFSSLYSFFGGGLSALFSYFEETPELKASVSQKAAKVLAT